MTDHTVKAFTDELEGLVSAVSRMGGLAEKAVIDSIRAMSGRDIRVAQEVIANDVEIDDAQRDIEKRIMRLLALRHPMAKDLRQTIAALKLAADIERINYSDVASIGNDLDLTQALGSAQGSGSTAGRPPRR